MGEKKEKEGKASSFVGRRPTCKSFRMAREMADFDGETVFGLSILMLLIKLQTAFREIYVDANGKIRVVKRRALQRERGTMY